MKLFQKMSNQRARCLLCPRYCELAETETGKCNARINLDGEIQPCTFGVVSSIAVEPIEKKPFKQFMPGTKTLSVGGFGCNLECKYCENWKISQVRPHPDRKHFTPQDIVKVAKEKHCQSVCMTYNEPTVAIEYLIRIGELCHNDGLKLIIKTNAYINLEPWKEICEVVDAMNIDFKGAFDNFENVTDCRYINFNEKVFWAHFSGVHVELNIPIFHNVDLAGYFFTLEDFAEADVDLLCHLFKVNPANLMIDEITTTDGEILDAKSSLSYFFTNIYV